MFSVVDLRALVRVRSPASMRPSSCPLSAVVLGDINVDLGFAIDSFPREGDDAQARHWVMGSGGGGLNAAVALASLGARTSLVGCVGSDPLALAALGTAKARGVDLSAVRTDSCAATGTCVVVTTPSGERTLFSHRGANSRAQPAQVQDLPLPDCNLLLVSGYALLDSPTSDTCRALVDRALAHHVPIAFDLGLAVVRACRSTLAALLPSIGLLVLNEAELAALAQGADLDRNLGWLFERGTKAVAVKRGAHGCTMATGVEREDCASIVVKVVDSTACGDGFAAASALGWACGLGLGACGRLGNLLGARAATRAGAAESLPNLDEIAPMLEPEVACALRMKAGR
jgi:ribokinase